MKYEALLFDFAGTLAYEKHEAADKRFCIPDQIAELVKRLQRSGYRLGLISNSHRYGDRYWLCDRLQSMGLLSCFECVVSSGAWGIHKPDPLIFLRPLHFMGVHPSKALMVGNSDKCDIEGAQKAGLEALYVDLDLYGMWDNLLIGKLEDPNLGVRKANVITDYVSVRSRRIACQVRHLSHPVAKGDYVIVGGCEKLVNRVDKQLTWEEVIDASRVDLIEIGFE